MPDYPILAYHRVGPRDGSEGDQFTIAPDVFKRQMELIREHGGRGIDLEEMLQTRSLEGERPVVLTFDDGFASNREFAWPVLSKMGFRATTFIVSGRLAGSNDWDLPSIPRYALLSADDCSNSAAPMISFQSHGSRHLRLPDLDAETLAREVTEPRKSLALVTGRPVDIFAYPFGCVSASSALAVRSAGYRAACTCIEGLNSASSNPLLLRRVIVHNDDVGDRFLALVKKGRRPRGAASMFKAKTRECLLRLCVFAAGLGRAQAAPR